MKEVMFLLSWHLVVLWLSFRETVQSGVESLDVVSSQSTPQDLTSTKRSLIYTDVALDAFVLVGDVVARQHRELGGGGYLTFITLRPSDGLFRLFLYVFRRSSVLTVSGLLLLDFFL